MGTERSLASEVADIKEDLKTFFQTRAQLLRAETKEKLRAWKRSLVLLALAALFLVTCWITFVFSLVALLHTWIVSGSYGWFWGGLIISVVLGVSGAVCGQAGFRGIKASGIAPKRTLRVLRQDQQWIQKQARPA
ncbi:MAG TPA: phage holin family protein [Candidatus Angelobacter sp.]